MYSSSPSTSDHGLPAQSNPVNRHAISDMPKHWIAGGDPNAAQEFREPEDCGCHILSGYAVAACLAACRAGMLI